MPATTPATTPLTTSGPYVVAHGTGTPLVLLHGFAVDHRLLLPLDPVLAAHGAGAGTDAGWRRLYIDLPGMGRSPSTGVDSSEDVVAAVRRTIVEQVGDRPFALLGCSYGGMIARRLAHDLRGQVLGLALLAALCGPGGEVHDLPPRTARRTADVDGPWWDDVWVGPGIPAPDDPALADYRTMAAVPTPAGLADHRRWVYPGVAAADPAALARLRSHYPLDAEPEQAAAVPFDRPTLLLTGRQDHAVGWTDAWRLLPHYPAATYVVLDGAGHNVHLEQPTTTAAAITDWLDRVQAAG